MSARRPCRRCGGPKEAARRWYCDACSPVVILCRILGKVRVDEAGCWVYTGSYNRTGYGLVTSHRQTAGRSFVTHRYVYEQRVGPIPKGLTIDHLCRNRACCNPSHLQPVTMAENNRRGFSPTALNARKTHCVRGHPYDAANTYWHNGKRTCLTCKRAWKRAPRMAA